MGLGLEMGIRMNGWLISVAVRWDYHSKLGAVDTSIVV